MRTVSHRAGLAALAGACLVLDATSARAEGGPPMITDDTATPEAGHWEINMAMHTEHAGDSTTFELPLADINYGIVDHVQLKFEIPWEIERIHGQHDVSGAGNSIAGVKWRFFDDGDDGWKMSVYPQVQTRFPVSGSPLADSGVGYALPFEVERKFGDWGVNFDFGRWFLPPDQVDTWIGGIAIGCDVAEGLEIMGELHGERDAHSSRSELTLNFGTRWELSKRYTLLVSAGTDLHNDLDDKASLISYIGLQTNL